MEDLETRTNKMERVWFGNNRGSSSNYLLGFIIGLSLGINVLNLVYSIKLPMNKNPEYVDPRGIKFSVKDLNDDKNKETIIEYKGKKYLGRYDAEKNQVILSPYHVELAPGEDANIGGK